ncbi:MAG TPA: TIGR02301 family protein [Hyphomicrobiales bacterium]|nr:TIGR02301 family protein [Hyphomicrobiales bacterium]
MRAALLLAAVLAAAPAAAQDAAAPFEKSLLGLSELLGALHYLRPLCRAPEGDAWRARMAALLDAESAAPAALRERMAGAFNHGYATAHEGYHTCTPRARLLAQHYLDQGAALAEDIARRHGGS